jgi:hypothetical protein
VGNETIVLFRTAAPADDKDLANADGESGRSLSARFWHWRSIVQARPPGKMGVITLVIVLFIAGVGARVACWEATGKLRFHADLDTAWRRGSEALQRGHGDLFSGIVEVYSPANQDHIDYPPLRMYIKTLWVRYIKARYGSEVRCTDAVVWPMLGVNLLFDIAGAVGMYYFCRLRCGRWPSLVAACCLWFNPAAIFVSDGHPQWETWAVAPLLWAAWALFQPQRPWTVLTDMLMGLLLGLSAMLKGQSVIVLPWFLLVAVGLSWCEAQPFGRAPGRWLPRVGWRSLLAAKRLALIVTGMAAAIAIITLPFTLRHSNDWMNVYRSKVTRVHPLVVGGCNIPKVLMERYQMHGGDLVTLPLPGMPLTLPLEKWLILGYGLWAVVLAVATVRQRKTATCLLGLGVTFAALFALLPEMHERYTMWAAVFLAATVCVGFDEAILFVLITCIALATNLYNCIGGNVHPVSFVHKLVNDTHINLGYLWLFCAVLLTWQMFVKRESATECPAASCPPRP